jgi:hypothetical protein
MTPISRPLRLAVSTALAALLLSACGTPTPLQNTGIKACEQLAAQLVQGQSISADTLRQQWGEPWRRMQVRTFDGALWEYRFLNAGTLWSCYGYVNPAGQLVKVDDMQVYLGEPRS